jgi:hypothetical protein
MLARIISPIQRFDLARSQLANGYSSSSNEQVVVCLSLILGLSSVFASAEVFVGAECVPDTNQ